MTPEWTRKPFAFAAVGPVTELSFGSVPMAGAGGRTDVGVAVDDIQLDTPACQGLQPVNTTTATNTTADNGGDSSSSSSGNSASGNSTSSNRQLVELTSLPENPSSVSSGSGSGSSSGGTADDLIVLADAAAQAAIRTRAAVDATRHMSTSVAAAVARDDWEEKREENENERHAVPKEVQEEEEAEHATSAETAAAASSVFHRASSSSAVPSSSRRPPRRLAATATTTAATTAATTPPTPWYALFTAGKPLTGLKKPLAATNVQLRSNSATVTLAGGGSSSSGLIGWIIGKLRSRVKGTRWQSPRQYTSGVFQCSMVCPSNDASGRLTSFFLSSNAGEGSHDGVSFDFVGNNRTQVLATYHVAGKANALAVPLDFSCDASAHTYTIYWDAQYTAWYVDKALVRILVRDASQPYPSKPAWLYGTLRNAAGTSMAGMAGSKVTADSNTAMWKAITAIAPLLYPVANPPAKSAPPSSAWPSVSQTIMTPFKVDYCTDHCEGCTTSTDGSAVVRYDNSCGSRFRSSLQFAFSFISGDVMCPGTGSSGIVSSFYMSSLEGSGIQDEIDFEWLGKTKTNVQTNFYVKGVGGNEKLIPLGFDCSTAYHNYALLWTPKQIVWYIDYKVVRVQHNPDLVITDTTKPFPSKPSYFYASAWDASKVCNGCWSGNRSTGTTTDSTWKVYSRYKNIKVMSPLFTM
eukprot:TRINITY_DN11903_c0_g1_i3.p1 TRINITY_DN11903_c0_g1~~TRINITY_DN11903_c0_g1_i3.p1  ORF type:complete len:797 (-),score=8.80 TRINITY_DN11903_c0_g1_i3:186-2261(-)